MGGPIPEIAWIMLAVGCIGSVAGFLLGAAIHKRRTGQLIGKCQAKVDDVTRKNERMAAEFSKARSTIASLQAAVAEGRAKLKSILAKSKRLTDNVVTLRAERENTKIKVGKLQYSLVTLKQQTSALQREFDKVGEFYKGELAKSFEKRKVVEEQLENARLEHESFAKVVESSILEHGSPDEMITAAQLRLGQLDILERNVTKLEAENAQLRDDAARMKQDYEALKRDLAELDELRINNKQLVRCVEALESSRQQHELDADRYREQADQSEQASETLRLKLHDLEKNFADIQNQQNKALKHARKAAVIPSSNKKSPAEDADDLQETVGLARYSNRR